MLIISDFADLRALIFWTWSSEQTDTASVLHEAAACIRQLHQQIQVIARQTS